MTQNKGFKVFSRRDVSPNPVQKSDSKERELLGYEKAKEEAAAAAPAVANTPIVYVGIIQK